VDNHKTGNSIMNKSNLKVDAEKVIESLETYIRNLADNSDGGCVMLGLSGGIDSSILLALIVRAVGKERVQTYFLNDRDSEAESEKKAEFMANWLGVKLHKRNISQEMKKRGVYSPLIMKVSAFSRITNRMIQHSYYAMFHETPHQSTLKQGCGEFGSNPFKKLVFNLTIRHLEAGFNARHRYRREVLEQIAKEKGCVLLGAANRSEGMVGWFVKDGIDDLPIQPMIGLYKTQVWQLADYLKLPDHIRHQKPSPDMMKGITDEFAIGMQYERLDEILDYLEKGMSDEQLTNNGVSKKELKHVQDINRLSAWKRESEHVTPPVDGGVGSSIRIDG
jgi:NAD+ synthase